MQHGVLSGVLQHSSLMALPEALGTGPLTLLAKWPLLLWGIVGLDIVYLDLLGIASRRHCSKMPGGLDYGCHFRSPERRRQCGATAMCRQFAAFASGAVKLFLLVAIKW